jgi:hypothetical protein
LEEAGIQFNLYSLSDKKVRTWDRCYDFLKIFSPNFFGKKISVFDSNQN